MKDLIFLGKSGKNTLCRAVQLSPMLVSNTTKEENGEGTFQVASEHRQLHRCGFVVLPQLLAHKVAL